MSPDQDPISNRIVLHISGMDKPGITARLCQIIADHDAQIIDMGQSVLNEYLVLSAIAELPSNSRALREILFAVHELGFQLEVTPYKNPDHEKNKILCNLCVTLLGDLSSANALAKVTDTLAKRKINIKDIKTLTENRLKGVELVCEVPQSSYANRAQLKEVEDELFFLAAKNDIDLSLQEDNIFRRNKRLLCCDVDSTFIPGEVVDSLGELVGKGDEIAKITEEAMQGKLDFEAALRARVKLLKGLDVQKAREYLEKHTALPETELLVKTLKKLGFKIGLVSGGFDFFVNDLKEKYQLDFAFSNKLVVKDNKFTGELEGTIVDAKRKAQVLQDMAEAFGITLDQCIAIGDGANDIDMLKAAGLGIAYQGKSKLQEVADTCLNKNNLDGILYLLGFNAKEIRNLLDA